MDKPKCIIFLPKLSIGGMEKAFVNFVKFSDLTKKYNVDIYLGYNENDRYYNELLSFNVNIHLLCKGKWNIFNKIKTYIKYKLLGLKIKNKYDLSICYSHHHKILANLSRKASKDNVVFIHTDLIKSRTKEELNILLKKLEFNKFSNVVCVSNCVKESFKKLYPNYKGKIIVANNYIDGEFIIEKSKNNPKRFNFNKTTFINLSRHDESHKKVSYLIEATKKLVEDGYKFDMLLLGDGQDHNLYLELVEKYNLDEYVHFTGSRSNPYKYLKHSDALVISSAFEGYGIVLDEARVLEKPIITTDVADAKEIINEGYGILCENSIEGIYEGMKQFLDKGFKIKTKFDYKKFNNNITKELNKIFDKGE